MIIYYIQYIIVVALSSLTIFKKNSEKYICIFVYLLLAILPILKGSYIDRDFGVYQYYFSNIVKTEYFKDKILYYEPINYLLPFVVSKFAYQHLIHISLAILTALGVYLKLKSFRISNSFFLSIALYLTNFYLLHEWTQLRAGISSAIFLLSIKYILERDAVKYSRNILLACLFHYSSIIYLPVYLINPHKVNLKLYLLLFITISIASILNINIFNAALFSFIPKIQAYSQLMEQGIFDKINIWNNAGFLINYIMTLLILLNINKLILYNKYLIILLKINIFSILIYMVLSPLPAVATRASQMLGVVQICLFPIIIFLFKEKWVPYLAIILISLIYFYNHYIRIELLKSYYMWI